MKRTAGLKYKKYTSFNKDEITNIYNLVQRYCEQIRFESETQDGSKIEFDSFEELVNYSNYGKDRIKSLDIYGHTRYSTSNDNSIHIQLGDLNGWEKETIRCSYSFKNKDDETIFRQEIVSIFEKNSNNQSTYIGGYVLSLVLFALLLSKLFFSIVFSCFQEGSFGLGVFFLLAMFVLVFGASAL